MQWELRDTNNNLQHSLRVTTQPSLCQLNVCSRCRKQQQKRSCPPLSDRSHTVYRRSKLGNLLSNLFAHFLF